MIISALVEHEHLVSLCEKHIIPNGDMTTMQMINYIDIRLTSQRLSLDAQTRVCRQMKACITELGLSVGLEADEMGWLEILEAISEGLYHNEIGVRT